MTAQEMERGEPGAGAIQTLVEALHRNPNLNSLEGKGRVKRRGVRKARKKNLEK